MKHQRSGYICQPTTGILKTVLPFAGLTTFILAWFFVTDAKVINPNFLPSPMVTLDAFLGMFHDAPARFPDPHTGVLVAVNPGFDSLAHSSAIQGMMASVTRIATAVWRACLIGIPIGIAMGAFGEIESFFAFLIPPMRNAPITAFIALFMVIFGISEELKINFLTFGTLVYIIPTTLDAIRNVEAATIDNAVDFGFKKLAILWYFVIPEALPRIYAGVRICTGIAWTYLAAAESVNITNGLGAISENARRVQNTPKVYAAIILIIILGVLTDYLFRVAQNVFPILKTESEEV